MYFFTRSRIFNGIHLQIILRNIQEYSASLVAGRDCGVAKKPFVVFHSCQWYYRTALHAGHIQLNT